MTDLNLLEKANKIVFFTVLSTLIVLGVLLSYVSYMTFYPFEVVNVENFKVTTTEVVKGDFLFYDLKLQKSKCDNPSVEWYLVDSVEYKLNTEGTLADYTQNKIETSDKLYIPTSPAVPPDNYQLRLVITCDIFPLRKPIEYTYTSNQFSIITTKE